MRDVVRDQERWKRRHTPTQYPSTDRHALSGAFLLRRARRPPRGSASRTLGRTWRRPRARRCVAGARRTRARWSAATPWSRSTRTCRRRTSASILPHVDRSVPGSPHAIRFYQVEGPLLRTSIRTCLPLFSPSQVLGGALPGRGVHVHPLRRAVQDGGEFFSTTILGMRTTPFTVFLIPNRVPHGFTPRY